MAALSQEHQAFAVAGTYLQAGPVLEYKIQLGPPLQYTGLSLCPGLLFASVPARVHE